MKRPLYPVFIGLLIAAIVLGGVGWLDQAEQRAEEERLRGDVIRSLSATRARLESSLNQRLSLVQGLAAFARTYIRSQQEISEQDFYAFAQALQSGTTGIRSLQLQPDAVVKFVYPLQGNEAVVGHDLLVDPERRDAVQKAIDARRYVLAGPVTLIQGGSALIGRMPLYSRQADEDLFWGFAAILIDLDPLLRDAGLDTQSTGVIYSLRGVDGLGASGARFYGLPPSSIKPIEASVALPGGEWILSAYPANGWKAGSLRRWYHWGLGVLSAFLAGVVSVFLLRTPMRLKGEIEDKAQACDEEMRRLVDERNLIISVIDTVPDMIFCKDFQGRYLICNQAYADYLGLDRSRLIGNVDEDLFPHDVPSRFHALQISTNQPDSQQHSEEWVTFADGSSRLLDTVHVPYVTGGVVQGSIGISRDCTGSKLAEQALQRSEKNYRDMINGLDELLFRISLDDHCFTFLNSSAEHVLGYSIERLHSEPGFIHRIVHPESQLSFSNYWQALLRGDAAGSIEYSIVDEQGCQRWLMQSARLVLDAEGLPSAVEGICRDITSQFNGQRLLRTISEGISGEVGEAFFASLVRQLAASLEVDIAFVARLDQGEATTLAVSSHGQLLEGVRYSLADTPCCDVTNRGVCVFPENVAQLFPDNAMLQEMGIDSYAGSRLLNSQGDAIGLLVILHTRPLKQVDVVRSALNIFAVRAAAELQRIEDESRLKTMSCAVQQSPVAIAITAKDGCIEFANDALAKLSGYEQHELSGMNFRAFQSEQYMDGAYEKLWEAIRQGRDWHGELQGRYRDGRSYWTRCAIYPISVSGDLASNFVLFAEDIGAEKAKDAHLKMAATVFDTTSEAIIVTDADNRIEMVNPAFTAISGYSAAEVIGRDPGLLSSGHHDAAFYADMFQALNRNNCWEGEIWNRRKNGELYPEWLSVVRVLNDDGQTEQHVAVFSDISKRKAVEGLLYRQSNYDRLTELPNRLLAADRLASALTRARRLKSEVAVLSIGLDRFKWINDTYGHDAGDSLLRDVALRLSACVGETDTVARLNGDEFLVVLPDIQTGYASEQQAAAICSALLAPFELNQGEAFVSASVGIALYPHDAHNAAELMHHADSAMWRTKEAGANGYQFYRVDMNKEAQRRSALELDLRRAIIDCQFEVYYQPLISIVSGQVTGAEALLRWNHPQQGVVLPGEFIGLAEETGLIVPVGHWVMAQVCEQLRRWTAPEFSTLRVAVNLSAKQCQNSEAFKQYVDLIAGACLDTRRLVVEITESLFMDEKGALRALRQLRGMGVKLSMDDFGTGYSSLSYLKRFPIDILKIDREFIRDLPEDRGDAALVEAIIAMARSLELEVVAEGVENMAQVSALEVLDCNYLQGFYYAHPMTASAFEDFVKQYNATSE